MVLDWHETPGWWQADVEDATRVFRGQVRVEGTTHRIYKRGIPPTYELCCWRGPAADRPAAGADENLQPPTLGLKFSTLEEAKSVANNLEINHAHFPYHAIVNGFGIQFQSDIDGYRYVIVDERDHDMAGWKIEISGSYGRRVEAFERDHRWFCYDTGVFDCFGYGGVEMRAPWTALCNHLERIVRWIPPDTISD